jgi:hypothetical protein
VNVRVPATSAALRFLGWSGDFGGEAFEDDAGLGEPGLLEWGPRLDGPGIFFPKLGRPAPPPPPLPFVVGPGGRFADVPAALAALAGTHAGERVTLELATGAHAAFELDARALAFDLALTSQPGAWIDASAVPLRILDLRAGRSLELVGLGIDAGKAGGHALEVLDCAGVVLLDGTRIEGSARLASSLAVALQDSVVTGELALERGSRAAGSGGALGHVAVEPGSSWSWHERGPRLVLDGSQATLTWEASGLAWLLASPRLGLAAPTDARVAGNLLLDRTGLRVLAGPRPLLEGRTSWRLPDGGPYRYVQALVFDRAGARFALSAVRAAERY